MVGLNYYVRQLRKLNCKLFFPLLKLLKSNGCVPGLIYQSRSLKQITMVKHFNFSINENDVRSGAIELLKEVRPSWDQDHIKFKTFTEGITNVLFGCYSDNPEDIVLIRIYGFNTDLLISRSAEVATMQRLASIQCAAPLYATFQNGICYGYVSGDTVNEHNVRDDTIRRLIAQAFARIHRLAPENGQIPEPVLFPLIRRCFNLIPNQNLPTEVPSKEKLNCEIALLETHLSQLGSPVVFCHNDGLLNNIIYDKKQEKVTFIDFEYAGYNFQAFDLGNHFCEFSGVTDWTFSRYPDREFQLEWLRTYLNFWRKEEEPRPRLVTDLEVERLYVQVNKFALASHLLWGLWGLVQSVNSTIKFDFLGFAMARLRAYFARKDEFLALKMPSSSS